MRPADVQDAVMGMAVTGMDAGATLAVVVLLAALVGAVYLVIGRRGRRGIATPEQRATYDVLHRAGLAADPLRSGLDATTAAKAVHHLRALVGSVALGLANAEELLVLDGPGHHHPEQVEAAARKVAGSRRTAILRSRDLPCDEVDCPIRGAVVAPLSGDTTAVGALVALTNSDPAPGLVQATL